VSDERKEFDCPKCGGLSFLDPATLRVEHSEPKCEDWLAMEAAMLVPLQLRDGHSPAQTFREPPPASAVPELVQFACPECKQPARMFPRSQPIGVEHSLPPCKLWQNIHNKKDDVERYLIKAGVHIHVPDRG
jgi:predicted RNA-binding Zn-ribbon protein involved in translation (DUF1610 family)